MKNGEKNYFVTKNNVIKLYKISPLGKKHLIRTDWCAIVSNSLIAFTHLYFAYNSHAKSSSQLKCSNE